MLDLISVCLYILQEHELTGEEGSSVGIYVFLAKASTGPKILPNGKIQCRAAEEFGVQLYVKTSLEPAA